MTRPAHSLVAQSSRIGTHLTLVTAMALFHAAVALAALTETCLTGTAPDVLNDASQIRAARALVDAACVCSSFDGSKGKTHSSYVKCAGNIIKAQVPAQLRARCKTTVKKLYARSTCGTNPQRHAAPCIQTSLSTGTITCKITFTTKRDGITPTNTCANSGRVARLGCQPYTHCIDASDVDGNLIIAAPGDSGSCVATPTPTAASTDTATPSATPTSSATPTPNESGALVIFPKVISDGTRDTMIALTNTSASVQHVLCVYVDTSTAAPGTCSGTTPPGQSCSADADCFSNDNGTCVRCQPSNFTFSLPPQGSATWFVSQGSADVIGAIPPHPLFLGELKCFPTDIDGVPIGDNALSGDVTIEDAGSHLSQYRGVALQAISTAIPLICAGGANNGDVCTTDADCTDGVCRITLALDDVHYSACPQQLVIHHYAEVLDPGTGATVHSELTLVPCSEDLAAGVPTSAVASLVAYNELEQQVASKLVPFTCWLNISLGDPRLSPGLDVGSMGTTFGRTTVSPATPANPGLLGVLEEFHVLDGALIGTAASNPDIVGSRPGDVITLPGGQ